MSQIQAWLFDATNRRVGHFSGDEADLPLNVPSNGSYEITTLFCPQGTAALAGIALERYLGGEIQV